MSTVVLACKSNAYSLEINNYNFSDLSVQFRFAKEKSDFNVLTYDNCLKAFLLYLVNPIFYSVFFFKS